MIKNLDANLILQENLFNIDKKFSEVYLNLLDYINSNPNFYRPFCIYKFNELKKYKNWNYKSGYIIPFGLTKVKASFDDNDLNYIFYLKTNDLLIDNFSNIKWSMHAEYENMKCSATIFKCCYFLLYKEVNFLISNITSNFIHFI